MHRRGEVVSTAGASSATQKGLKLPPGRGAGEALGLAPSGVEACTLGGQVLPTLGEEPPGPEGRDGEPPSRGEAEEECIERMLGEPSSCGGSSDTLPPATVVTLTDCTDLMAEAAAVAAWGLLSAFLLLGVLAGRASRRGGLSGGGARSKLADEGCVCNSGISGSVAVSEGSFGAAASLEAAGAGPERCGATGELAPALACLGAGSPENEGMSSVSPSTSNSWRLLKDAEVTAAPSPPTPNRGEEPAGRAAGEPSMPTAAVLLAPC